MDYVFHDGDIVRFEDSTALWRVLSESHGVLELENVDMEVIVIDNVDANDVELVSPWYEELDDAEGIEQMVGDD